MVCVNDRGDAHACGLQMREARQSMKWHGQTGCGVMDKCMGKIGWLDMIGHDNTAREEAARGCMEVAWGWQVCCGGPEVCHWGAGTRMGPGACHVRGMKGSQMR